MRLLRALIWAVTVLFIVMMFYPLVQQMLVRLSGPSGPDFLH